MSEAEGRAVEIQFSTVSTVERAALPLLSSLVYGELYTSEMLNSKDYKLKKAGIYAGMAVVPKDGLTVEVIPGDVDGLGVAMVTLGTQNITVFQQHAIDVTLTSGSKWYIVLEGYYERGVKTKQVDASSLIDSATIKAVLAENVTPEHVVLSTVDLSEGATTVLESHIDLSMRVERSYDVADHEMRIDPHPQYTSDEEARQISQDTVADKLSDNFAGASSVKIATEKALSDGLATKAPTQHSHGEDELVHASLSAPGITQLSSDVNDTSQDKAATPKAVNAVKLNADSRILKSDISDSLESADTTTVASSKAASDLSAAIDVSLDDAKAHTDASVVSVMSVVNTKVNKSSISNSISSDSETSIASSKAVHALSEQLSTQIADLSDSSDSSNEGLSADIATKVNKSSISDSTSSDSSTTVASSKAVKSVADKSELNLEAAKDYADSVKSDIMGGLPPETFDTFTEIAARLSDDEDSFASINAEIATKVSKSSISDSIESVSPSTVASSKAVKLVSDKVDDALDSANAHADSVANAATAVANTKVAKSSISSSTDSASTTTVASSKAVSILATRIEDAISAAASGTSDSEAGTDLALATKVDKSSISNSTTSTSTTNVASSKAVKTVNDVVTANKASGLADTAAKVAAVEAIANAKIATSSMSNSTTSTSSATVATSKAVKAAMDVANSKINQSTANGLYLGILDKAADSSKLDGLSASTSNVADTVAVRNSLGDLNARLFRSTGSNQPAISGAMAFRINNTTDNYIRFCSSQSAIRTWMNTYSKSETTALIDTAKNALTALIDVKVSTSKLSNSVTSTSTSNVATSKAAKTAYDKANSNLVLAKAYTDALKEELFGGVPKATMDTFKEISDKFDAEDSSLAAINAAIATKIATSKISNSVTSTSTSNVASSAAAKAAYDKANSNLTLAKADATTKADAATAVANAKIAKTSISNSVTSSGTTTVASSKAVRDAYNLAASKMTQTQADARYFTETESNLKFLMNDSLKGFGTNGRHVAYAGNLNDIKTNSIYGFVAGSVTNEPTGISSWGYIHTMVYSGGDSYRTQMCYSMNSGEGEIYMRHLSNNTWGSWKVMGTGRKITLTGDATGNATVDGDGNTSIAVTVGNDSHTHDTRYLRSFQMEDGDGTEVTISQGKEIKFVEGGNIDINFTDTSTGSDSDPFDLKFTVPNGTTGVRGAVQLNSAVNSTSTTLAATPAAVKTAYDLAATKMTEAFGNTKYLRKDAKTTLTDNDGYGNANLTFNHTSGKPIQNGSAARIEVATDSATASMSIELKSNVVAGTAVDLTQVATITEAGINSIVPLSEGGDRVYSPNNRNISSSVTSTSTTKYASSKAAKLAYDLAATKITEDTANGLYLGTNDQAADSLKLGGRSLSSGTSNNTVALRNGSGDLYARLFRSTYANGSTISGALAFRISTTDNFIRFCSSTSAIRTWLSTYSKAEIDAKVSASSEPTSTSFTYASGNIKTMTEVYPTGNSVSTYAYYSDGRIKTVTVVFGGVTKVTTYSYNGSKDLTSVTTA